MAWRGQQASVHLDWQSAPRLAKNGVAEEEPQDRDAAAHLCRADSSDWLSEHRGYSELLSDDMATGDRLLLGRRIKRRHLAGSRGSRPAGSAGAKDRADHESISPDRRGTEIPASSVPLRLETLTAGAAGRRVGGAVLASFWQAPVQCGRQYAGSGYPARIVAPSAAAWRSALA